MAAETEGRTGAEGTATSSEETTEGEGHLAPERGAWPGASPPGQSRAGEERAHLTRRLRAEKQREDKEEAKERGAGEQAGKAADAKHRDGPEGQNAKEKEGKPDGRCMRRATEQARSGRDAKTDSEKRSKRRAATAETVGMSGGAAEGRARSGEEEEKRASRLARDGQRRRRFRAALRTGRSQKPGHAGPPRQAGQIVKNAKSGRPPESGGRRRDRRRGPGVRQGAGSTR